MLCRAHLSVHLKNLALFIDDIGDAFGVAVFGRLGGAIFHSDIACRIAQKRVRKAELFCKCRVFFHRVKTDAKDLNILFVVILDSVAEPATLCRSTRRVRLRIKPQDDPLAVEIGKLPVVSGVIFYLEIGSPRPHLIDS